MKRKEIYDFLIQTTIICLSIMGITFCAFLIHIHQMTPERIVAESIDTVLVKGKGCPRLEDCHELKLRDFEKRIVAKNLPKPRYEFNKLVQLDKDFMQDISMATHPIMLDGHKQVAVSFDYFTCAGKGYMQRNGCSKRSRNHYVGQLLFTLEKPGRMGQWQIIDVQVENLHESGGV